MKCRPHTGAWIETLIFIAFGTDHRSPPIRGRGLKHIETIKARKKGDVAPHTGAWIETSLTDSGYDGCRVAPHTGAWIETGQNRRRSRLGDVAPHTGAWIETAKWN